MSKEIVKVEQQVAKLNEEKKDKLFHAKISGMVGVTEANSIKFPREIKIVQSNTGDKWFENENINDRSAKGKMFITPERRKNAQGKWEFVELLGEEDLYSKLDCTLLKVETGCEIWKKEKKEGLDFPMTVVKCRSKEIIPSEERDAWYGTHNPTKDKESLNYTNQVRLILTKYPYIEVIEMMKEGLNPFITITLEHGGGWSAWNYMRQGMTEVKKLLKQKGELEEILSSVFRISLTTEKDGKFFNFKGEVTPNDFDEALKFEELVEELDRFTFFYNSPDNDPSLRNVVIDVSDKEEVVFEGEESTV